MSCRVGATRIPLVPLLSIAGLFQTLLRHASAKYCLKGQYIYMLTYIVTTLIYSHTSLGISWTIPSGNRLISKDSYSLKYDELSSRVSFGQTLETR